MVRVSSVTESLLMSREDVRLLGDRLRRDPSHTSMFEHD
jgi:hypothetical protein